jgi:hypothetical protein
MTFPRTGMHPQNSQGLARWWRHAKMSESPSGMIKCDGLDANRVTALSGRAPAVLNPFKFALE